MDGSKELHMVKTKPISLEKAFWLYGVGCLSALYLVSSLALFTPIGITLGVPLHIGFLYLKIALFVAVCGYGAYRIIRLIVKAGRASQGSKLWVITAVAAVTFATITLLVVMPPILVTFIAPFWHLR